jgi:hypothetical protein
VLGDVEGVVLGVGLGDVDGDDVGGGGGPLGPVSARSSA